MINVMHQKVKIESGANDFATEVDQAFYLDNDSNPILIYPLHNLDSDYVFI